MERIGQRALCRRAATAGLLAVLATFGGAWAQPTAAFETVFATQPGGREAVSGFTAYGGDWSVDDGVVRCGPGPGPRLMRRVSVPDSAEFTAEVMLPGRGSTGNVALVVRGDRFGIGADAFDGYEIALDGGGQFLLLGKHRQNFEALAHVPYPVPYDTWVELSVRLSGDRLIVSVDGKVVLDHRDSSAPLTGGHIGLRPWQREGRYRNLRLTVGDEVRQIPLEPPADDPGRIPGVCDGWRGRRNGTVQGGFAVEESDRPLPAGRVQRLSRSGGTGVLGVVSEGPVRFPPGVPGEHLEGTVWARADADCVLGIGLEGRGDASISSCSVTVPGGTAWQAIPFRLGAGDGGGEFAVSLELRTPGTVRVARLRLTPGDSSFPGPMRRSALPPFVFLTRHALTRPPAVGNDIWAARPTAPGCAIRILDPSRPDAVPRTIFSDPAGSIYDLNLSRDARSVLFSLQTGDDPYRHLFRIGIDGDGLTQLTRGPYDDISPCELPDGGIAFVTTRRYGHTVCQPGPASNLYRMEADGTGLRCLSMNTLSDMSPQLLPDGRILFTRWEYVDRDLTYRQSLWTTNPDGTMYRLYFGNTIRDPGTFWQARPFPGRSDRVIATFAPHHGWPHGALGVIETNRGPEEPRDVGFRWLTPEFPTIGDVSHEWSYRDPFPLTDDTFLCAYGGGISRFRIVVQNAAGIRRVLYEDPVFQSHMPIPLRPAEPSFRSTPRAPVPVADTPILPEEFPPGRAPTGTFVLADVYEGLGDAIPRGAAKEIRIMEQVRKTEGLTEHPGDRVPAFGNRAYDQNPLMSYATYYAKRCWGTVPVEPDGSAHFTAPALREIYFQVCDGEGRELRRMTSAAQLMPEETVGCTGCHESRVAAPPPRDGLPAAARRAASTPVPPPWAPDGIIDFTTVVQPVLDEYCVRCHGGGNPAGGYDFSGDKTRLFSMAYDNLLGRSQSRRRRNGSTGDLIPEDAAKPVPLVQFDWLLETPTGVVRPLETGSSASRLPGILESDHCERVIPPEARRRVYTWLDANCPYYGTYANSRLRSPGKRDLCSDTETGGPAGWFTQDFLPVYARRCASCHGDYPANPGGGLWDGRLAWLNFTRPELSPALTAHLALEAGGRGIVKTADGKEIAGFADTADPDYRAMLTALETGARLARENPRADMPGFRFARKEP